MQLLALQSTNSSRLAANIDNRSYVLGRGRGRGRGRVRVRGRGRGTFTDTQAFADCIHRMGVLLRGEQGQAMLLCPLLPYMLWGAK